MPRIRIAVLCLLLAPLLAGAQSLWQGSSVGMSVQEVASLFPAAVVSERPGNVLSSGAKGLLELGDVQIIGRPFVATFFFKGDRLTNVNLSSNYVGDGYGIERVFEQLTVALRSKYGGELTRNLSRSSIGTTGTATWTSGKTSVSVYASSLGLISVGYSTHVAESADKL